MAKATAKPKTPKATPPAAPLPATGEPKPWDMAIEVVEVASLTSDPRNAVVHGERNLQAIVDSLIASRQQKPLVVGGDGLVYAGNGTLAAAIKLGWTHVTIHRTHLTGAAARKYALADNRTSDLHEYDLDALNASLSEIEAAGIDVDDLAITDADLAALADGDFEAAHAFAPKREKPEKPPAAEAIEPQFKIVVTCTSEKQQAKIIKYLEEIGADYKAPSV